MKREFKNIEDLPATLNADQVSSYLGISRGGAFNLLNSQGFPTLRIGKRMVVTKESFVDWLEQNIGKSKEEKNAKNEDDSTNNTVFKNK